MPANPIAPTLPDRALPDRVLLGRITGAHGIRGEVSVHAYTVEPADIAAYGPLADAPGTRSFTLKVVRVTPKGAVIARINGVSDRNAAEAMAGTELYVERDRLPATDGDEFYHADLIGLSAVTAGGSIVGEVVSMQNYGAGDLIEIRPTGSKNTELIPFTNAFVSLVDLDAGQVIVDMPVTPPKDSAADSQEPLD